MKPQHLKTATIFLLIALQTQMIFSYPTYSDYVKQFGKQYKTAEEYSKHEEMYNERIAKFSEKSSFTPGINQMTDMLPDQIQAMKNLKKEDVGTRLARPLPLKNRLGFPASLDWRDHNAITSIKDQGLCGACWAFAAAAYVQSKLIIANRFTASNINLSEQYLVSCTAFSNCDGGYLEKSLKASLNLPSERAYPYRPFGNKQSNICSAHGVIAGDSSADYYSLSDNDLIGLLQAGPVAISINSDGWQEYGSGTFQCQNTYVNHAVLLIGYTADFWIIKNQWGRLWGMSGYMQISRAMNKNCGIGYSAHILVGEGNSANDIYYTTDSNQTTPKSNETSSLSSSENSYFLIVSMLLALMLVLTG